MAMKEKKKKEKKGGGGRRRKKIGASRNLHIAENKYPRG